MRKLLFVCICFFVIFSVPGNVTNKLVAVEGCQGSRGVWNNNLTARELNYFDLNYNEETKKGESVCDYTSDYNKNGKAESSVVTCEYKNGKYDLKIQNCNSNHYYCIEEDDGAECVHRSDLPYCNGTGYYEGETVAWGKPGCVDEKTLGMCYHDGVIREVDKCAGTLDYCYTSTRMQKGNAIDWFAKCETSKCRDGYGTVFALDSQQCDTEGRENVSYHDYRKVCTIDGWSKLEDCDKDTQECYLDGVKNKTYCVTKGVWKCGVIGDTSIGREVPTGESICYGGNPYLCNSPPEYDSLDICTEGEECREYIDGRRAACVPEGQAHENGEVIEAPNTSSKIYDPSAGCTGSNQINVAGWCFPYGAPGIASKLLQIVLGIAGGVAFLLLVYGFILVGTASGDEKKMQAAKETITSAIIGLLISLFSLFIFRLVVVNILQIPGIG